jgi:hypothetical protein
LDGRPDRGFFRGALHFLRFPSDPLGILVICMISASECLPPWINPKALLLRLGVHSRVFVTSLTTCEGIEALFILVVELERFLMVVVAGDLVIVPVLSATSCIYLSIYLTPTCLFDAVYLTSTRPPSSESVAFRNGCPFQRSMRNRRAVPGVYPPESPADTTTHRIRFPSGLSKKI